MITKGKQSLSWDSLEAAIVRLVSDEDLHMSLLCGAMHRAFTQPKLDGALSYRATPRITASHIQLIVREYHPKGEMVTKVYDLVQPTDGKPLWVRRDELLRTPVLVFRGMPFRTGPGKVEKIEMAARVS